MSTGTGPAALAPCEVGAVARQHGELVHESGGGDEGVGHAQTDATQLPCPVGDAAIDGQ